MPIYGYECDNKDCVNSQGFEEQRSIHDSTRKRCPLCRYKVQRVYSSVNIAFKGTGWYVTDYKGKTNKPPKGEKRVSVKRSKVSESPGSSPRFT